MNAVLTAPATETKPERITSYYREGSSDKVYQAAIEPEGDLFVVNFAFGRQGSTLSTGTKTSSPVDYETAKRIKPGFKRGSLKRAISWLQSAGVILKIEDGRGRRPARYEKRSYN